MEKQIFSPMAIDALGEMMNISLGSSATAVSNMLDHRVDITTPTVSVVNVKDFALGNLEPAIGVEIRYVEGLEGSNIMLLKRTDIKMIVDILMGTETPDEEFELNELTISCVCEVMNQMMGSAATAMSDFLGYRVDISTPQSFELDDLDAFKQQHMPAGAEQIVVVRFFLKIEGAMESEFMNVMSVDLAKKLLSGLGLEEEETAAEPEPAPAPAPAPEPAGGSGGKMSQEEIEKMLAGMGGGEPAPAPAPTPAPAAPAAQVQQPMPGQMQQPVPGQMQQPMPGQMPYPMPGMEGSPFANGYMGYPPMYYPPYPYPYPPQPEPQQEKKKPDPKLVNTKPLNTQEMEPGDRLSEEQAENLDLIMEVPLQVTVEIGRARRKVQDILEFTKGSLVVLDKLAGDQVDLFVNGKCIARGDVVVVEDNFGVRITEIVQNSGVEILTKAKK